MSIRVYLLPADYFITKLHSYQFNISIIHREFYIMPILAWIVVKSNSTESSFLLLLTDHLTSASFIFKASYNLLASIFSLATFYALPIFYYPDSLAKCSLLRFCWF